MPSANGDTTLSELHSPEMNGRFPGLTKYNPGLELANAFSVIVRSAIADPLSMSASDGILKDGKGHPRAAGTYSRILGVYVRETKTLTLMGRVIDKATYTEPGKYSEGIRFVLVNGMSVVKDGQLQVGVKPGQAVRAPIQ